MAKSCARWLILLVALLAGVGRLPAAEVDYAREVKPLLKQRCYACHGALKQQAGLRLDTGAGIRQGGGSGAAVNLADAGQSLLLKVVSGEAGFRMPPEGDGKPLSEKEIALLRSWIEQGAKSPADEEPEADPKTFWSYQPVERPAVPAVQRADWVRNPVDAFIAAEHERRGLSPRPAADRAVLLRRVYLDLIGLPPTRDELHAFLADDSRRRLRARRRRVCWTARATASAGAGTGWTSGGTATGTAAAASTRFATASGTSGGGATGSSSRSTTTSRYDQMVREMLAGDELAPADPQRASGRPGFLGRNWYKFDRNVWMFDTVEQTSQAFLGLTLQVLPLPRPQVRPDHAGGLLPLPRVLRAARRAHRPRDGRSWHGERCHAGAGLQGGPVASLRQRSTPRRLCSSAATTAIPTKPRRSRPVAPTAFGFDSPEIAAVALPPPGWAPALKPKVIAGLRAEAADKVSLAVAAAKESLVALNASRQKLAEIVAAEAAGQVEAAPMFGKVFHDDFSAPRPDVWTVASGQWDYADGHVTQSNIGAWQTANSNVKHPRDFMARVKYRTLEAGRIHSVGVTFDAVDVRDGQAVYSATNNVTSTIQAFHREGGVEQYPAAGIIPWPIKLGELVTVDLAARGQQLNVWVNGELAIAYIMPMTRREGVFALWTHAGAAEFHELSIDALPEDFRLAQQAGDKIRSPYSAPTKAEYERAVALEERRAALTQKQHEIALAEQQATEATIVAEQAKVTLAGVGASATPEQQAATEASAKVAAAAQRGLAVLKAALEKQQAEQALLDTTSAMFAADDAKQKAVAEAQKKRDVAQDALVAAEKAVAQTDAAYTPLGTTYPATSTGRRTALARWITDARNPRTARVAVNHIWLRHFGEALVPTVANFGMNGTRPSHPALLDWLAAEFTDHHWSMKHIHRLLVTSNTYRLTTTDGGVDHAANLQIDPANRYLWRMNSRRMEAEVVRDSVLSLAGKLDLTPGGPEIAETLGEQSNRRSLYFRSTPNEKVALLELFDRANPNECYRRQESVVPQQALALANSLLSMQQAQQIAARVLSATASQAVTELPP